MRHIDIDALVTALAEVREAAPPPKMPDFGGSPLSHLLRCWNCEEELKRRLEAGSLCARLELHPGADCPGDAALLGLTRALLSGSSAPSRDHSGKCLWCALNVVNHLWKRQHGESRTSVGAGRRRVREAIQLEEDRAEERRAFCRAIPMESRTLSWDEIQESGAYAFDIESLADEGCTAGSEAGVTPSEWARKLAAWLEWPARRPVPYVVFRESDDGFTALEENKPLSQQGLEPTDLLALVPGWPAGAPRGKQVPDLMHRRLPAERPRWHARFWSTLLAARESEARSACAALKTLASQLDRKSEASNRWRRLLEDSLEKPDLVIRRPQEDSRLIVDYKRPGSGDRRDATLDLDANPAAQETAGSWGLADLASFLEPSAESHLQLAAYFRAISDVLEKRRRLADAAGSPDPAVVQDSLREPEGQRAFLERLTRSLEGTLGWGRLRGNPAARFTWRHGDLKGSLQVVNAKRGAYVSVRARCGPPSLEAYRLRSLFETACASQGLNPAPPGAAPCSPEIARLPLSLNPPSDLERRLPAAICSFNRSVGRSS